MNIIRNIFCIISTKFFSLICFAVKFNNSDAFEILLRYRDALFNFDQCMYITVSKKNKNIIELIQKYQKNLKLNNNMRINTDNKISIDIIKFLLKKSSYKQNS